MDWKSEGAIEEAVNARAGRGAGRALVVTLALAATLAGGLEARAEDASPAVEAGDETAPEAAPAPAITPTTAPVVTPAPIPRSNAAGTIEVLFTSDLEGALVDTPCGDDTSSPLLPRVGAAVTEARREATSRGAPTPVVIDAGDALFPSALVSHEASEAEGAAAVARALREAGYDVLAAGDATLSASSTPLGNLLAATRRAEAHFVLTNIECGEEADDDECQAALMGRTSRYVLLRRGDRQIGVVAAVPEHATASVRRATLGGAEMTAPAESIETNVRALRERGADLVILISNLDTEATAPRATLDLVAALDAEARPDLVITAETASVVTRMQAAAGGVPLLSAAPGELQRVVLRRDGARWVVEESGGVDLPAAHEGLAATVTSWNREFCERFDRPLAGGALAAEVDQAAFAQLVLQAMREQTGAEIAVINRRAISSAARFPLSGQLTAAQVQRALPVRTELRVARVRGSEIGDLATAIAGNAHAYSQGIDTSDGLRINGREVISDGRYRVVTTAFVARGGENIIEDRAADFEPVEDVEGLDSGALPDRVVYWLEHRGEEPWNPEVPLDLHRRGLWYGSLTLDANFGYTAIRDDNLVDTDDDGVPDAPRYDQGQLRRDNVINVAFAADARGGLSLRGLQWDNRLQLRYGQQGTEVDSDGDGANDDWEWAPSDDQILFRTALDMDYLRDVVLDGAWYGPSIFLELGVESEFQRAEDAENHFLELTGLLGLKLKPLSWLRFSAAGGIRSEVLAPDPYPIPGLNLRLEIVRTRLGNFERLPIHVAALAEYFVGWPVALPDTGLNLPASGSAVHKFTAELRLEVTLIGPLRFVGSVRGFVYDEDPGSVATAFDATAGLSVGFGGHRQTF